LEVEFDCLQKFQHHQADLSKMMARKAEYEQQKSQLRLQEQRQAQGYDPQAEISTADLNQRINRINQEISGLDTQIGPLAHKAGMLFYPRWGLLTRSGFDKSYLDPHPGGIRRHLHDPGIQFSLSNPLRLPAFHPQQPAP
jgi:hypothetical protein